MPPIEEQYQWAREIGLIEHVGKVLDFQLNAFPQACRGRSSRMRHCADDFELPHGNGRHSATGLSENTRNAQQANKHHYATSTDDSRATHERVLPSSGGFSPPRDTLAEWAAFGFRHRGPKTLVLQNGARVQTSGIEPSQSRRWQLRFLQPALPDMHRPSPARLGAVRRQGP